MSPSSWLQTDVAVIGAGATGASTAAHLAQRGYDVVVLEKEKGPACHQSGRNSGVIHSGYNLKPGSLKARFCIEGSRRLRDYCVARRVPMVENGILVVARTQAERGTLDELKARATANGVRVEMVDGSGIRSLEPHATGLHALHSPEGASFDSRAFVESLLNEARRDGAQVVFQTRVRHIESSPLRLDSTILTSRGTVRARLVVNCAGLHADRLAGQLAGDVRVIPFRGYYAEVRGRREDIVRGHVYSAPDLAFPFLGVHVSRRTDGRILVGPGAMLAFGREAYHFWGVQPRDLASTLAWPGFHRLLRNARVRAMMRSEIAKSLSLGAIAAEARLLFPELQGTDLVRSFAGNRAQLVRRDGTLVDDLVIQETDTSLHLLNVVSPGLTCSLPLGDHLSTRCHQKLAGPTRHTNRAPQATPVHVAGGSA